MQIDPPSAAELEALLGPKALAAWRATLGLIDKRYEMETLWGPGGRAGPYELKYRRGGKTLCALYPRQGGFGFMVILGKAEREKFEAQRAGFSPQTAAAYDGTHIYHDGLWLMLEVTGDAPLADMERLLEIKRRPNRKGA